MLISYVLISYGQSGLFFAGIMFELLLIVVC